MINVFVCTYNPNLEFLERTVKSINAQNLSKDLWDFTIIDNNSKNPVKEIDFIRKLDVRIVEEKMPGLTAARKCAAADATGDILVFVDDDNVLDNDYLFWVNKAFDDPEVAILSGAIFPEYLKQPERWFFRFEEMLAIRRIEGDTILFNSQNTYNSLFAIGAGMAIRRELIRDYFVDPINVNNLIEGRKGSELSSGEDIDLDFYALYKGKKIGCFPKMKLKHIMPEGRLHIDYLTNLCVSSLKSSFLINRKWRVIFGHDVFDFSNGNNTTMLIKSAVNWFLGLFSKRRHMRAAFLLQLYKLKNNWAVK